MPGFFFISAMGVVKLTAKSRMNENPPKLARHRFGKKCLKGLLWLALLVFVVVQVLNLLAKHALNRYERQWEAKGEYFDFASFIPQPVPDDQNFALTPIVATTYAYMLDKNGHLIDPPKTNFVERLRMETMGDWQLLYSPTNNTYDVKIGDWAKGQRTDLKSWQNYYRALAAKTNKFPVAAQAQSPAADVLLALSKYDATIEELRQAAAMPYSRFPLNYDRSFNTYLMHLAGLKDCSRMLQLRAIAELQNGQSDLALADVKLMLRLMDSIRTEPFLISHQIRIHMLNDTLQPVWEGLADHKWSDVQLVEVNQELAKVDFLADYEFIMRAERTISMGRIENLRITRDLESQFPKIRMMSGKYGEPEEPIDWREQIAAAMVRVVPSAVFYQAELIVARAIQEWDLPIVDVRQHTISLEADQKASSNIAKEVESRSPLASRKEIVNLSLPALQWAIFNFAHAQSSVDMARVACALERYRLAQGNYPEMLDALQPSFIETLPHDVIGGQPLKYHRTDNGQFKLYSVGWNGIDDGGTVVVRKYFETQIDSYKGDWVWTGQVISIQ
jgi:hypothetical protein